MTSLSQPQLEKHHRLRASARATASYRAQRQRSQRSRLTTKMMPQTASHLRRLDAGFHSNFTQLYGVNWNTILFILPLQKSRARACPFHKQHTRHIY